MFVRRAGRSDFAAWGAMRLALWPDIVPEELEAELTAFLDGSRALAAFVAEQAPGRLAGFAEASIRSVAEGGPDGPAAYLEGLWVEPEARRRGVARALLAAVEGWAREQGLGYLGSDALLDNEVSHAWHRAAGFAEVERLVVFGKSLADHG